MAEVRVGETSNQVLDDGRHHTRAAFSVGDSKKGAYFTTSPDVPFVTRAKGDIWLPTALIIAMARHEDLVISDPISSGRLKNLTTIQDILTEWYPTDLRRAKITAEVEDPLATDPVEPPKRSLRTGFRLPSVPEPEPGPAPLTVSCFTGGVDSFHTLVTRREEIDAVIYGYGIDVPLTEVGATERVEALLDRVTTEFGVRLLTAETNIRRIMGPSVSWGFYGHGAGIVSLATIFSGISDKVMIPATHSYAAHLPWGSHPLLDPLWSTERLEVEHVGSEAGRVQKIQLIADEKIVQDNLRVCYAEFDDLNCGRCKKCLRTMATLATIDRLDEFKTFAVPLDLDLFASLTLATENDYFQILNLDKLVEKVGGHKDIHAVTSKLLDDFEAGVAAGNNPWRPGDPTKRVKA